MELRLFRMRTVALSACGDVRAVGTRQGQRGIDRGDIGRRAHQRNENFPDHGASVILSEGLRWLLGRLGLFGLLGMLRLLRLLLLLSQC